MAPGDGSNKTIDDIDDKLDLVLDGQGEAKEVLNDIKIEQARQDERISNNADNIGKAEDEIGKLRSISNRLDVVVVAIGAAITGIGAWFGGSK